MQVLNRCLFLQGCVLLSLAVSTASASELSQAALDAKASYTPVTAAHVKQAADKLTATMRKLDRFVSTNPPNGEKWKSYLLWSEVQNQIGAESPDLGVLQRALSKYRQNEHGLELGRFTSVRAALQAYINAVQHSSNENIEQIYASRLDELSQDLASYAENPTTEDALQIGRNLGFLSDGGHAADLSQAIQQQYWHSNLSARVSRRLIAVGIEQSIDQTTDIREHILGTSIRGTAHTVGQTSVQLQPNSERAAIGIQLAGTASGKNVGTQRGVTIHTRATTNIDALKTIYIDEAGFHSGATSAHCDVNSTITGICAKKKFIEKIAWKKAAQSKCQAERIAGRKAEARVSKQLNEQADESLSEGNESFVGKVRTPLIRRDAFPRALKFSTDENNLFLNWLQAGNDQIAASDDAPALDGDHDLSVRLHESMVANFSTATLGNYTLTDEELAELLEEYGEVPEELKIGPDKDPWSITFTSNHPPFTAAFADNTVRMAIRGSRFTRGDQEIRNVIEISATYSMEVTPKGAKLIRQGDVVVTFFKREDGKYVALDRLGIQQIAFKTFIQKKFEAMFEPEFAGEGLALPGRWEKAGKLKLATMNAASRWLTLAWDLPAAPAPATADNATLENKTALAE